MIKFAKVSSKYRKVNNRINLNQGGGTSFQTFLYSIIALIVITFIVIGLLTWKLRQKSAPVSTNKDTQGSANVYDYVDGTYQNNYEQPNENYEKEGNDYVEIFVNPDENDNVGGLVKLGYVNMGEPNEVDNNKKLI